MPESSVKYPYVAVVLVGASGNAFAILARVRRALQRAEVPDEDIEKFFTEATSGDYDHLLQTVMKTVTVN